MNRFLCAACVLMGGLLGIWVTTTLPTPALIAMAPAVLPTLSVVGFLGGAVGAALVADALLEESRPAVAAAPDKVLLEALHEVDALLPGTPRVAPGVCRSCGTSCDSLVGCLDGLECKLKRQERLAPPTSIDIDGRRYALVCPTPQMNAVVEPMGFAGLMAEVEQLEHALKTAHADPDPDRPVEEWLT